MANLDELKCFGHTIVYVYSKIIIIVYVFSKIIIIIIIIIIYVDVSMHDKNDTLIKT